MSVKAEDIVVKIGTGIQRARETNERFLGVEAGTFENADIHPEYVTTVKVGEALVSPEYVVTLEARMSQLRPLALNIAMRKWRGNNEKRKELKSKLENYVFGDKDGQRLDVLVRPAENYEHPILMAEAKLGIGNPGGIRNDVDRIVKLFDMFKDVDALSYKTYGAVVFHHMVVDTEDSQGNVVHASTAPQARLLKAIKDHLKNIKKDRPWLKAKADMLKWAEVIEPAGVDFTGHEDGEPEPIFAKHGFRFTPGLILLGTASDVTKTKISKPPASIMLPESIRNARRQKQKSR